MTRHFAVAILTLSIVFSLEAQKKETSNLIEIHTKNQPAVAFKKLGRLFLNERYELETTEPTFFMLTTKVTEKSYGFLSMGRIALKFYASIDESDNGSVITLTGKFLADAEAFQRMMRGMGLDSNLKFDADASVIEEGGMSGSPLRVSWNFMKGVAEKYEGGVLVYKVKRPNGMQ